MEAAPAPRAGKRATQENRAERDLEIEVMKASPEKTGRHVGAGAARSRLRKARGFVGPTCPVRLFQVSRSTLGYRFAVGGEGRTGADTHARVGSPVPAVRLSSDSDSSWRASS